MEIAEIDSYISSEESESDCQEKSFIPNDNFFEKYYLTDQVLGSGSGVFADVLAAYRKKDNKRVAVKVIDPEFSCLEVEILRRLRHRNIVRFYDYFDGSVEVYGNLQSLLIMECMEGGELLDRIISRTAYDEMHARDAARNVLLAVQFCHRNNILHRDLKPDNLLLKSKHDDADLKLADFGVAIGLPEGELIVTEPTGTARYTAPEILLTQPYGKPVDMWSFGVILYILLCGQFPFMNDEQVITGNLTLPEGELDKVSPEASHLVRSLLKFNANERLTVDEALMHPWLCQHNDMLRKNSLTDTLPFLRNFLARRKFKGSVHAVIATNKFSSFSAKILQQQIKNADLPPVPPMERDTSTVTALLPPPTVSSSELDMIPIEPYGDKAIVDDVPIVPADATTTDGPANTMTTLSSEINASNSSIQSTTINEGL
eukprot:CAMPEP_0170084504 /NCGR_PEP_ID=MMETSP0019_2-20121128/19687_1 /TAXON_ID=98059 /ORGANISM="Dinobryon sp., Strain UTEXLB2267" /LENGTH=429 /DNA_ID=CAMNT_0010300631 /DNA_START=9 /DNA_END=1298 /DNA_ORIENTATION=+